MQERLANIKMENTTLTWEAARTVDECEQVLQHNTANTQEWFATHQPLVVMCEPTYFYVDADEGGTIAGNGFVQAGLVAFNQDPEANKEKMLIEWREFRKAIAQCGAEIVEIEPHPDYPDQVFTADHSFSCVYVTREDGKLTQVGSQTIISQLANPHRLDENKLVKDFFNQIKDQDQYQSVFSKREFIEATTPFEGIGDNLLDPSRGIVLSGFGCRNAKETSLLLHKQTGLPVYSFENKTPFFHIDTYCAVLPGGYVMYAPEVMHEHTLAELEKVLFKGHQALKDKYGIVVSKEDALHFACNAVCIGTKVIMQDCSQDLKQALASRQIEVIHYNVTVSRFAGGGLHCMSNVINQPVFI